LAVWQPINVRSEISIVFVVQRWCPRYRWRAMPTPRGHWHTWLTDRHTAKGPHHQRGLCPMHFVPERGLVNRLRIYVAALHLCSCWWLPRETTLVRTLTLENTSSGVDSVQQNWEGEVMLFSLAYARGGFLSKVTAHPPGEGGGHLSGQSIYMLNERGHAADSVNAESEYSVAPKLQALRGARV